MLPPKELGQLDHSLCALYSCSPTILQEGANALLELEEGCNEVALLWERRVVFGPLTFPCLCMALK